MKTLKWRGVYMKPHPLKWFTDRIGKTVFIETEQREIKDKEQCKLMFEMQTELNVRYTEFPIN